MNSVMSSIRARNRQEAINRAVENACNKLCSIPGSSYRLSTRAAKSLLLNYPTLIVNGVLYSTQVRNVGAGVKEVYLKSLEVKE